MKPKNIALRLLPLACLAYGPGLSALTAGTYTNDFSSTSTAGFSLFNPQGAAAEIRTTGGNPGGYLKLTDAVGSTQAVVVFPDFESGFAISAFTFEVDCRIGNGTGNPADGFSISVCRPNDPVLPGGTGFNQAVEEGTTTGLAIAFDTYDNGGGDVVGFTIRLDGTELTSVPATTRNGAIDDPNSLQTGPIGEAGWAKFKIDLKTDGNLDIFWKDTKVVDNVATGWIPSPARVVFGARTGGEWEAHHFDNLKITTVALPKAALDSGRLTSAGYEFKIRDFGAQSVFQATTTGPNAISLELDGAPVTLAAADVSKTGEITTIKYVPATMPDPGSKHTFVITGKDQAGAAITAAGTASAPVFPAVLNGPAGSLGKWGMREWHKGSGLTPDVTGTSPLGSVVTQLQALTPESEGVFEATNVPILNHSDPFSPGGRGNFNNELPFIGNELDGEAEKDDDNVAVVAKTQISVPAAGLYTIAIHSDDGAGIRISGGPDGNTGKFIKTYGGGTAVDPGDPQTATFVEYTGDSNLHAVYEFSAPGTYNVDFVAFEGGGGAFWEVAWSPGDFAEDRNTNTWSLIGTPSDPSVPPYADRYIPVVPGPAGTAGNFGVRVYTLADNTDNLDQANAFLRDTTRLPSDEDGLTVDVQKPYLNGTDPQSGGGPGTTAGDEPFPGNTDADDNRVVVTAHGRITVPTSGYHTFWAEGDDGFMLRIKGVDGAPNPSFKRVTAGDANGSFSMSAPNEMFYTVGTGNSDTRGIIFLEAGSYDLEYFMWEGGGGFWYELASAPGEWPHGTNPPDSAPWKLVGYTAPSLTITSPGMQDPGWLVKTSKPTNTDNPTAPPGWEFSIAGAEAAIAFTQADETAPAAKTSTWDVIDFTDPQAGNGGSFGINNPFPLNTNFDDDNYAMLATGNLVITEAGEYNLGFQGDDGGYMTITGPGNPTWSSIVATNHPNEAMITEDEAGSGVNNRLQVQVGTGNSRTIGSITLGVGTYAVKTLVYEGGGGSWWEVIGSRAPVGVGFTYPLLAKGAGTTVTDVNGLQLVGLAGPLGSLAVTNVTATGNPVSGVSITFGSTAGKTYTTQYSFDLTNWVTLDANVASGGASTTVNIPITGNAALAGKTRVFFRASEN